MRLRAVLALVLMVVAACGPTTTVTPAPSIRPTSEATTRSTALPPTPSPTASLTETPSATPSASLVPETPDVSGAPPTAGPSLDLTLSAEPFVQGLPPLVFVTNAGDGSGLLYAVGQEGIIFVLSGDGSLQEQPFLDIADRVVSGGEQGLLGLAFHPDYESNGRYFVNYTNDEGDTVISEFALSAAGGEFAVTDPESERILLTIDQPFDNHNGGMIAFGPDGFLYIGMGDGGSGGDPMGNGQGMGTLLGKMLRIDVNTGDPYGVPADNPFVGANVLPEIWSLGWRNPWRFSFDLQGSGAMFVGDVGQHAVEEIDAEPASAGGRNYGWNTMEGDLCFRTDPCGSEGLTLPVAVNHRENGECAITGGYVYRGASFLELNGTYIFSDHCSGELWAFDAGAALATGTAEVVSLGFAETGPSSFGEDEAGELYLVNLNGEILRLVASRIRP